MQKNKTKQQQKKKISHEAWKVFASETEFDFIKSLYVVSTMPCREVSTNQTCLLLVDKARVRYIKWASFQNQDSICIQDTEPAKQRALYCC